MANDLRNAYPRGPLMPPPFRIGRRLAVVCRGWLGGLWDALPAKRPFLEPLRRTGWVPEPIYRHLHFHGVFSSSVGQGSFLMKSHGGVIENEVFWSGPFGSWEGGSLRTWKRLAVQSRVILDVGANAGLYAMVAGAANPGARIFAFEPVRRVFQRLAENASLNGQNVHCVEAAVSNESGFVTIYEPNREHPLSATVEPAVFGDLADSWTGVSVPSVRLDDFMTRQGVVPDLIKVDTEGHEEAVVEGLGDMLGQHRPTLVVEALTDVHVDALRSRVADLDYEVFQIDEALGPLPLRQGEPRTTGQNLLLRSRERSTEAQN